MIVEALLGAVKFLVLGVIKLLPTIPDVGIGYLDYVFQVMSMTDLLVNISVLATCLSILFIFKNAQLIWGVIMWVIRKLPFVK